MQRLKQTVAGLRQPDTVTVLLICVGVGFELFNALALGSFSLQLSQLYRVLWIGFGILFALRFYRESRTKGTRCALGFFALCDLGALLSVLYFGFGFNLLAFSMIRLFQLIAHFEKQDDISHVKVFLDVLNDRKPELALTVFISAVSLLLMSSLFFLVEKPYHGESATIYTFFKWSFGVLLGKDLFVSIEPHTGIGFLLYVSMVFLGIAVVALPISILSGGFADAISQSTKLKKTIRNRNILNRAFQTLQTIPERKLVADLALMSWRKYMTVEYALTRIGLTAENISDVIKAGGGYRLKAVRRELDSTYEDQLVVERFEPSAPYGTFTPRSSRVHVISTQSASDVFTGHFTATIAATLGANYYSNEYFSSGDPLPEKQCNFAKNDAYLAPALPTANSAMARFIQDLQTTVKAGDFVLYLGTCRANVQEFHVLGGGGKGVPDPDIANPTLSDPRRLGGFRKSLLDTLDRNDYGVCGSDTYQTDASNHLAHFIHDHLKADCIIVYVNIRILRHVNSKEYFQAIKALASAVSELTEEKTSD